MFLISEPYVTHVSTFFCFNIFILSLCDTFIVKIGELWKFNNALHLRYNLLSSFYLKGKFFLLFLFFVHLMLLCLFECFISLSILVIVVNSMFVLRNTLNLFLTVPTPRSGNFHDMCTLSLFRDLVPITSEKVISEAILS